MITEPTPGGALSRFLRYTTQTEPAITVSLIAAVLLYLVNRVVGLTDDDLEILGPVAFLLVSGIVTRRIVFSPDTHEREVADAFNESDSQQGGA